MVTDLGYKIFICKVFKGKLGKTFIKEETKKNYLFFNLIDFRLVLQLSQLYSIQNQLMTGILHRVLIFSISSFCVTWNSFISNFVVGKRGWVSPMFIIDYYWIWMIWYLSLGFITLSNNTVLLALLRLEWLFVIGNNVLIAPETFLQISSICFAQFRCLVRHTKTFLTVRQG